ncbi:MAG: putative bifunctional diguanylate cyclase/phosphodiesterase, partial [Microthrixaceae bacterium]
LGAGPVEGPPIGIDMVVHRDDLGVATQIFERVRKVGQVVDELRLRHENGTYLWFEVTATDLLDDPNVNGVLLNARAIDDRKAAEQLLLLSEARFKALVQNNTDLVMVIDDHERVSYASPSSATLTGEEAESLYGRQVSGVFQGSDIDWESKLRDAAASESTFEFGFTYTSGDWRTFEATVSDLRDEPAVGGFVLNARDITERKSMVRHLHHQATHDSLTGLANRVLVVEELDRMLDHNAGNSSVAAICIDLDDFRDINDSLGQAVGDEVLVATAARLRSILEFGDQAARIGADEFAVIVERAHGEEMVLEVAESILAAIAMPVRIDGRELTLSASAGLAVDHNREVLGEGLLRNAVAAMHEAKQSARSRVVQFEDSMRAKSSDRLELRGDLVRAIGTEQFVVNYQPMVNLEDGRIIGAEALVRWDHPDRGRLSPGFFIPLAEDAGLIDRLDAQVRRQACADLSAWRAELPAAANLTVSVNLSVSELHSDELLSEVLRDLRENALPAEHLVLEVTESHLLDDTDTVRRQMASLRANGIKLSIDDFGTGYSSLGYIDKFDFDVLKIDRSFVSGLTNPTNQRIVSAVLDLAGQLEAKVVAEGIETTTQEAHLVELGCRVGQGFLYSRPVPAQQFRRLLSGLDVPVTN